MAETENLRERVARARCVLFDFDGPVCGLFAGHASQDIAVAQAAWLERQGLNGLFTEAERKDPDPHVVLRALHDRHPDSDLVSELEERLTQEELRAVPTAMPTPYADVLIRTWRAVGARLAVATNNSPRTVRKYLALRGLTGCFHPHIYGRSQDLSLLKPAPHVLERALTGMGAAPSAALMIGDTPADCLAAQRAGVPFLGYARNAEKEKSLRAAGAVVVVTSLKLVRDELLSQA